MKTMMRLSTMMIILMLIGLVSVNAQSNEVALPSGFVEHGHNSSDNAVASEATDSVTVGSVMQYWAAPDSNMLNANNVYTWTVAVGTASQTAGGNTNLATVTFGGAATTGTIQVVEGSPAPASCTDGTPVSINVAVIAAPTATFGTDPAAVCTNNPVQTFSLPVTLSTAVNNGAMRINYTVYNPGGTVLIAAQDLDINESAASFNVTLTGATLYGTYYVIINSVTDRISRKPATDINGTITDNRIDLVVNRTPVTGPVYHVPNM